MTIPFNLGETGELLLKAMAIQCMKSGEFIPAIDARICSLHVGDFKSKRGTYSTRTSCPEIGKISSIQGQGYKELQEKLGYAGIVKAGTSMKADIEINGFSYSIKSSSNRPAIINHTFRKGFIRITKVLGIPIEPLDQEVSTYWKIRNDNRFNLGEDLSGPDRSKAQVFISSEFKEYFRPIFNYFAFTGTGRSDSPKPADCILEFIDPTNHLTWKIIPKATFYDLVWPDLIFSVRDKLGKGKQLALSSMRPEDKPWAQVSRGKIQAQLHVRTG